MNGIRRFLATNIYTGRYLHVDYWSILHVALFFFIGMKFPNQWGAVILGSLIFEFIENKVSKKVSFLREDVKDTFSDIGFNLLGYWIGVLYQAGKLVI